MTHVAKVKQRINPRNHLLLINSSKPLASVNKPLASVNEPLAFVNYSKCASDLDIAESQVNDYICEDIIESWIFDESLDDFDPDIFYNDTLQLEE